MSRPIKVTPAVVERMQGMRALKFTNKEIGVALGLSAVTVQKALNVRHAFVSELLESKTRVRTLALVTMMGSGSLSQATCWSVIST